MTIQFTPNYQLPYPELGDTPDVPRDVGALANAVDTKLKQHADTTTPVGVVNMWMTANPPAGWKLLKGPSADCMGADNPGLAAMFGVDGGGQVLLPDARNFFIVGAGSLYNVGAKQDTAAKSGVNSITLTAAQSGMRAHQHSGLTGFRDRLQLHAHAATAQGGYFAMYAGGSGVVYQNGAGEARPGAEATAATDAQDHQHYIPWEPDANASQAHENRPQFIAMNFIIKAG